MQAYFLILAAFDPASVERRLTGCTAACSLVKGRAQGRTNAAARRSDRIAAARERAGPSAVSPTCQRESTSLTRPTGTVSCLIRDGSLVHRRASSSGSLNSSTVVVPALRLLWTQNDTCTTGAFSYPCGILVYPGGGAGELQIRGRGPPRACSWEPKVLSLTGGSLCIGRAIGSPSQPRVAATEMTRPVISWAAFRSRRRAPTSRCQLRDRRIVSTRA